MYFQDLTPQREGLIVKIHPDSESTLGIENPTFDAPHNGRGQKKGGGGRGSDLENTLRFEIYTVENPIFDTYLVFW